MVKILSSILLLISLACLGQTPSTDPGVDLAYLANFIVPPRIVGDPVTNDIVGWWKFNDGVGTTAADYSGNANTAVLSGAVLPSWASGPPVDILPYSVRFTNVSSVVKIPTNAILNVPDNFSISYWWTADNVGSPIRRTHYYKYGLTQPITTYVEAPGTSYFSWIINGSTVDGTSQNLNAVPWRLVVESFSFGLQAIWTNNVVDRVTTLNQHPEVNPNTNWYIGNNLSSIPIVGNIADFRIYTNFLSVDKVWRLWYYYGQTNITFGENIANDWASRVVSNGGAAPSAGTKTAIATFVNTLSSSNIYSKMMSINIIAPDSLIASTTPLITLVGSNPWVNHNFIAGDLTVNGLTGNGSTKYLDTGFKPNTLPLPASASSIGVTLYVYNGNNNNETEVANYENNALKMFALEIYGGTIYWACFSTTANQGLISSVSSGFTGYLSGNRTSSTQLNMYAASSVSAHAGIASGSGASNGSAPNQNTFVFAQDTLGSPSDFSSKTLSFVAFHSGLSTNESVALFNAVQSLRTSLGGGYR